MSSIRSKSTHLTPHSIHLHIPFVYTHKPHTNPTPSTHTLLLCTLNVRCRPSAAKLGYCQVLVGCSCCGEAKIWPPPHTTTNNNHSTHHPTNKVEPNVAFVLRVRYNVRLLFPQHLTKHKKSTPSCALSSCVLLQCSIYFTSPVIQQCIGLG